MLLAKKFAACKYFDGSVQAENFPPRGPGWWHIHSEKLYKSGWRDEYFSINFQLRVWSERVRRLSEDGMQQSILLANSQRKLAAMRGEAPKLRHSMDELQAKVGSNRLEVAELLIELEKERLFTQTFPFLLSNWFLNIYSNKISFTPGLVIRE